VKYEHQEIEAKKRNWSQGNTRDLSNFQNLTGFFVGNEAINPQLELINFSNLMV
jgi:hypothetical protein